MSITTYTSLHNHTEFSNLKLIDSINHTEDLIRYAFDLGLRGVAITDHDSISGHVRAWNYYNSKFSEEERARFKLILGNEIYLCRSDLTAETHQKGEKFYHLILLAKDDIGHEQIRKISARAWSRAYMKNIMRTPTYSEDLFEIIGEEPGHVIASTACLGGYPASKFAEGDYAAIDRHLKAMSGLFGDGNFCIELQPSHQMDQINYNKYMVQTYWGEYPFIVTTDSHYLKKEDLEIQRVFLNSKSSGDREVDTFYASAYMMGTEELVSYLDYLDMGQIETMLENTNRICDKVQGYNLTRGSVIPKVVYDQNETIDPFYEILIATYPSQTRSLSEVVAAKAPSDIHLLNLLVEPWRNKIADKTDIERYVVELDYEFEQLFAISNNLNQHMTDYFITMAKMIDIMWEEADTIVGPGRGSAGSSLVNYLLGITQIDPLAQSLELPYWRFIHAERPGLPDIDIDTEATKRLKVFNKVQEYFRSMGGDLINVCTFGTEGSKSAINTAARGLDVEDEVASYLTSMIPNARGKDWTLAQCYHGDDEHPFIENFRAEMDKNPLLRDVAFAIEGLVTRLGCHASGVLAINEPIWKNNGVMQTSKGILVTAYDLTDTEQLGGVKYDYLTVQALDKIRTCMNLLLEDDIFEWQGTLRATYNKYIHPDVIEYDDRGMWDSLYRREIPACFQFDTLVGGQAIQQIHPISLAELTAGNGLMRLMANEDGELPLDIYVSHKNNPGQWQEEMVKNGLTFEEMRVLEKYLDIVYGVAVSQEAMMRMSMDPHIANFTIADANILRKAVAKKKADLMQKGKELFYNKGVEAGTSYALLDYVWNKQILLQAGYSFSDIHAVAYSYIALQEMNLCYFYPSIYWKCACLSVDAGAINEEDYYNLVETGVIELTDEDDHREQNKVQYGKMAAAIIRAREQGIDIGMPDINNSRFGFTPNVADNNILFGLRGIGRIGEQIINEIILNRPYKSVQDFVRKMTSKAGKKLISKDRIVNLIKAGAFDAIEGKPREQILADYIRSVADQKQRLTLQNFNMLITKGLIPAELSFAVKVYNFTKYVRKSKHMGNYLLDDNSYRFFTQNYDPNQVKVVMVNGVATRAIGEKYWDAIYTNVMNGPRDYIKKNHDVLLAELNRLLFEEEYAKYADGTPLDWELEAVNFYHAGHPLAEIELPCDVTPYGMLMENDFDGFWTIKGKIVPKHRLKTIIGTVIDKDKTKGIVTLQGIDGVLEVKIPKQQFARYAHTITELGAGGEKVIVEDSFFEKGTHLLITGILRNNVFVPKVYRETGHDAILRIMLTNDGAIDYLLRKSE